MFALQLQSLIGRLWIQHIPRNMPTIKLRSQRYFWLNGLWSVLPCNLTHLSAKYLPLFTGEFPKHIVYQLSKIAWKNSSCDNADSFVQSYRVFWWLWYDMKSTYSCRHKRTVDSYLDNLENNAKISEEQSMFFNNIWWNYGFKSHRLANEMKCVS